MTTAPLTEARKREIAERCELAMLTALARIAELETEIDAANAKLRRLYNAMCSAMANWEPPDPGDARMSDAEWARIGKAQDDVWSEMRAVFEASPSVLYVAGMEPKP